MRTFYDGETYTCMTEERTSEWIGEVALLVPRVMRWLFPPPAEGTPLRNLPLPQVRVLFLLCSRGELTMRGVARSLGVAMSTTTQLVDRLESLGLVKRNTDRADRRVVRLTLTATGEEAIQEHLRERDERIAAAMARLTASERLQIQAGLRLLEGAARQGQPELAPPGRPPLWEIAALMPLTAGETAHQAVVTGPLPAGIRSEG